MTGALLQRTGRQASAVSATHEYWRIRITTDAGRTGGGNHFANVHELQFFDPAGVKLATTGGTALDSGHFNGATNDADKAFDGNFATSWSGNTNSLHGVGGNPDPVYLGYHFSSAVEVAFAAIGSQDVNVWAVEWSDDGSSWTAKASALAFDVTTTSHRYWRFRQLRAHTTQQPSAAEIEWRATAGGANQTGSGTAISGGALGGFPASNGYDANNATFWVSSLTNPGASWLGYDFGAGAPKSVNEFRLRARNDAFGVNEASKDFIIEFSDDNSTWGLRAAVLGQAAWSAGEVRLFTFSGA